VTRLTTCVLQQQNWGSLEGGSWELLSSVADGNANWVSKSTGHYQAELGGASPQLLRHKDRPFNRTAIISRLTFKSDDGLHQLLEPKSRWEPRRRQQFHRELRPLKEPRTIESTRGSAPMRKPSGQIQGWEGRLFRSRGSLGGLDKESLSNWRIFSFGFRGVLLIKVPSEVCRVDGDAVDKHFILRCGPCGAEFLNHALILWPS
jgi:hypothetical protein